MSFLRRVEVILQNSTNELLTLEGFETLQGDWYPVPPLRGSVVEKQSTGKWTTESKRSDVGAQAFVRLGCTKGYVQINWHLDWLTEDFRYSIDVPPKLAEKMYVSDRVRDAVVMMVTLEPRR